jgi:hypothetical protein
VTDPISAPGHGKPAQAASAQDKPAYPLWIFALINPVVKSLLQSPLHGLLSGVLMLLTFAGRTTCKRYVIPIGYFPWAPGEVISFSSATWRKNLRSGAPVLLLLRGRQVPATPTVIDERDAVIDTVEEFIKRRGLRTARRLPVGLPRDHIPTRQDLRGVPPNSAFIRFHICDSASNLHQV